MANFWLLQPKIKPYQKSFTRNWKRMGVIFHSLLVTHWNSLVAHYSLQNLLVTRCRSCSLQNITRYFSQNSLVTRCGNSSLQKVTRYSWQNLLVTRCRSCSLQKITRHSLWKKPGNQCSLKPIKIGEFYLFILYFQLTKNRERFRTQQN